MATVLSTLYPPLIDTFMPAFPNEQPAVVHFTVSPYNSSYEIQYLHVTLVNQKTNKNAFDTNRTDQTPDGTTLINGVWIIPFTEILNGNTNQYIQFNREANYYTLHIPPSLLKQNSNSERKFVVDCYYKVQLRFDKYYDSSDQFTVSNLNSDYLVEKRAYFSEWSSVCLLKAIPTITIHLNNFTIELDNYLQSTGNSITNLPSNFVVPSRVPQYVPGIIPFAGNLTFEGYNDSGIDIKAKTEYYNRDIRTTSGNEYLESYRIRILDESDNPIEDRDSGIIYTAKAEKTNNFYWLCDLTNAATNKTYSVELTFTTNNQYTFTKTFPFILIEPIVDVFNPIFTFDKIELPYNGQGFAWKRFDDPYFDNVSQIEIARMNSEVRDDGIWYEVENEKVLVTSEDGWVTFTITHKETGSSGYLFVKRATSLDNFKNWELIDCSFVNDLSRLSRTITDKTVGSLVTYKYACQYLTIKNNWSRTVLSAEVIYPDFHDILISRGNKQLAIRYNAQVSSMTPTVNRAKIDTLGGRYPKFAENAKTHYKQFQLSGLIIAESDYNRKFLNDLNYKSDMAMYDEKMGGRYMVRNDTIKEPNQLTFNYTDGTTGETQTGTTTKGTYYVDIEEADTDIKKHKRDSQKNTHHDLYPMDNWWWERKFREEAMEWLNDGEPKLYRSMPEGNMIVMIDSVSLTPNSQLGRRVWNFSATIYEIGDGYSLQELDSLGIYPIINDYEANFTGINSNSELEDSESNSVEDTRIRQSQLSQKFHVKANTGDNGTTIVNATSQSRPKIMLQNNDGDVLDSVDDITIGEEIGNLYQGIYKNYQFDPAAVKIKNLRIQFESLPQWYDLSSITPERTNPGTVFFTIQNGKQTQQVYLKLDENSETWKVETVNNLVTGELWTLAGMSITDFFTEWENNTANKDVTYYFLVEDKNKTYISNNVYNANYYKTKIPIQGMEYISWKYMLDRIYKKNNNNWELLKNNINEQVIMAKDSNYYFGVLRDSEEIDRNSWLYVSAKDINENTDIYKGTFQNNNRQFYYVKLIDNTEYLKIGDNQYREVPDVLYWKVLLLNDDISEESNNAYYLEQNIDRVYLKINDDFISWTEGIEVYTREISSTEFKDDEFGSRTINYEYNYIKVKDEEKPNLLDYRIWDDNQYFYKENEEYKSLKLLLTNDWFLFYEDKYYLIDQKNNFYYKIDDNNVPNYVPIWNDLYYKVKTSIGSNEIYVKIADYNTADYYYYYNNMWLKASDIDKNNLYKNISIKDGLPNYVKINIQDNIEQTTTYYRTAIEQAYPNYIYYKIIDFFNLNPYIRIDNKYYNKDFNEEGKYSYYIKEEKRSNTSTGNNLIKVNFENNNISNIYMYSTDAKEGTIKNLESIAEKMNYDLGYKLKLTLSSPYDSSAQLERIIFVNRNGYYQVPSNIIVKEITLYDGAIATLDYFIEYELEYKDQEEANSYEVVENVVGQISGEWDWNTALNSFIAAKYWAYDVEPNRGSITQQSVDSWNAVSFEGTPYTILDIQSTDDINSTRYIVGRTGVLNLQTEYPTASIIVNGKRMVRVPASRQKYLNEWEYVIDDSVKAPIGDSSNQFWYIVYNNGSTKETTSPVIIYLKNNFQLENGISDIINEWYNLKPGSNPKIENTLNLDPTPNTVYAIVNTVGGYDYKIYYLDKGWFNIEFLNEDYSIANARVPVQGTIEYRATIMKKFWDPMQ